MNFRRFAGRSLLGLKYLRYLPQMLPACIIYFVLPSKKKTLLIEDIEAFHKVEYSSARMSDVTAFYRLMVEYEAFRNVFYYRAGLAGKAISWLIPKCKTPAIRSLSVGGYLYSTWSVYTIGCS